MPQDIWLAGDENIYLISELLESPKEREPYAPWQNSDFDSQTGRSKKLALHYVMLALKTPGHRVVVLDHFDSQDAHYRLQILVTKIFNAIGVDYQTGMMQRAERNPNEFTGVKQLPDAYFVTAVPLMSQ